MDFCFSLNFFFLDVKENKILIFFFRLVIDSDDEDFADVMDHIRM